MPRFPRFLDERTTQGEAALPFGGRRFATEPARLAILARGGGVGTGRRVLATRREPAQVVVDVAVERGRASVGDQQEAVAHRPQQGAVVRHEHHAAFVTREGSRQRVAHLEVEMVRGFVQQQQVGPAPHQQGQCEPGFLAAGERRDGRIGHVAAEIEPAEVIAQVLLARRRLVANQVPQRRLVAAQLLHLVLGEVADLEPVAGDAPARQQRGASPASALISVDLPAPFGPSRPRRAPGRSDRSSASSTMRPG